EADVEAILAAGAYRVILADDTIPSNLADLSASGQNRRFAVRTSLEPTQDATERIRQFSAAGCHRFVVTVLPGFEPILQAFSTLAGIYEESPAERLSIVGAVTDYPSLRMFGH